MAKIPTKWTSSDGFTTYTPDNAGVQRIEQDSTIRIQQDGTIRVLEDNQATPKQPADWNDL